MDSVKDPSLLLLHLSMQINPIPFYMGLEHPWNLVSERGTGTNLTWMPRVDYVYHNFFFHLSTKGYLSCFHVLAMSWLLQIMLLWTWWYRFFFLIIYLVLAALGLCCCLQAFSSCREWGPVSSCDAWVSHCSGFSCCRKWALGHRGSVVVQHRLSSSLACGIFPGSNLCLWQ